MSPTYVTCTSGCDYSLAKVRQLLDLWILLIGLYFYVTNIRDLYQWL